MQSMAKKLEENAPYNLFFNAIRLSPGTSSQRNSITFTDLLCPSLGDLKCSLQLTYVAKFDWLMGEYKKMEQHEKPITVIHGLPTNLETTLELCIKYPNLTRHSIPKIHHSKIGIYAYTDDSIRIVVSTGNLSYQDWNNHCQCVWVSPLIPKLSEDLPETEGLGPTHFKTTLLSYLQKYESPILSPWEKIVSRADFSAIRVSLITSVPGTHHVTTTISHCHLHRVKEILSCYCIFPPGTKQQNTQPLNWKINIQSSSIGCLKNNWIGKTLIPSLANHRKCSLPTNSNVNFKLIYPTVRNVSESHFGRYPTCLHYKPENKENVPWLKNHLCSWKAHHSKRSRAMPHCKTYCRISPCNTRVVWFLLTSANLSKSAWGSDVIENTSDVKSFEAGILFTPNFFGQQYFVVRKNKRNKNYTGNLFPLMYDVPLTPYTVLDKPWVANLEIVNLNF